MIIWKQQPYSSALFLALLGVNANNICTYPQSCWPSSTQWASLNGTLNGSLIRAHPAAAPCHPPYLDEAACSDAKANWNRTFWRADQPGGYHDIAWENGYSFCNIDNPQNVTCDQGLVPIYMAQVKNVGDVQAAVRFAKQYKLSTRVKGASHDYLGRSSGNGTFGIQTIKLKGIEFEDSFKPAGAPQSAAHPAVHVSAGEQWYYVNKAADEHNVLVVGGSSYSVGAAGGWILGGGHSSLSPQYGLGVDNVLQFEIVTPDGEARNASAYENTDLFWALRGGGGGFGVVTKATYKTYPPITAITAMLFNMTYTSESYHDSIKAYLSLLPTLSARNFSGYSYPGPSAIFAQLLVHNSGDLKGANDTFKPLYDFAANETRAGRPVSVQILPGVLTRYFELFSDDPATVSESGGEAAVLGSRLVPLDVFKGDSLEKLTEFFVGLPRYAPAQILHIAGGAVNKVAEDATAVHPSWRRASHHLLTASGWLTTSDFATRDTVRALVTNQTQALGSLVPGFGCYINEADANEPKWPDVFWGSNYKRLLDIKAQYDPLGIFTCHHCVGDKP